MQLPLHNFTGLTLRWVQDPLHKLEGFEIKFLQDTNFSISYKVKYNLYFDMSIKLYK